MCSVKVGLTSICILDMTSWMRALYYLHIHVLYDIDLFLTRYLKLCFGEGFLLESVTAPGLCLYVTLKKKHLVPILIMNSSVLFPKAIIVQICDIMSVSTGCVTDAAAYFENGNDN